MRSNRWRIQAMLAGLSLHVTAFGCQLTPNFETGYEVAPWPPTEKRLGSLAVSQLEEARPPRYFSSTWRLWLLYIPLVPYASMPFERIDESVKIQSESIAAHGRGMTLGAKQNVAPPFDTYVYPKSIAEAVANDLRASHLFERVEYVGDESPQGYDWGLRGRLRAAPFRRSATSFLLGAPGVLLWLIPVPMAKVTGSISLDLELVRLDTEQVAWRRTLEAELHRYLTLYTSSAMVYGRGGAMSWNMEPPPNGQGVNTRSLSSWNFAALRKAMLEARPSLVESLSRTP